MRDIIQKIIATESEARLVVESAKAEADRILSEAQKKGHDIVEQARIEALVESDAIMEKAARESEKEKQLRLAETITEIERQIRLEPTTLQWAVEGVIRCICGKP
jgi:vacuolar-type H+-ATPase subunit H